MTGVYICICFTKASASLDHLKQQRRKGSFEQIYITIISEKCFHKLSLCLINIKLS